MYENIVVAFDNTPYSHAALLEAANWVKAHGGRVSLVHAVFFNEEEFGNAPEQLENRFELGRKVCSQAKEMVKSEFGISADALVCQGEPPDVITDTAREKHADLIAMGTYGRKGFKRLLMGSVTSGVIVNSPCDVLVVKKPCDECTGEYESILLPYDGSAFSKKALDRACELSKVDGAKVTVLYVIPRYEEMIGFLKTASIKESLLHEARKITEEAKKRASLLGVTVETKIEEGQAAEKIIEAADSLRNNLIVMGSYGWQGMDRAIMGSTTERVIIHASCPILVVR